MPAGKVHFKKCLLKDIIFAKIFLKDLPRYTLEHMLSSTLFSNKLLKFSYFL